jgi:hypothetical protein
MWAAMKRLAWVLLSVACGARTDLGGVHGGDAGSNGICSPAPPAPKSCTTWHAGTPQSIGTGALADATSSGCGVLVAWYTSTGTSIAWSTRWIDFDGAMLAPPLDHPSLAAQTTASAAMSMVEGGMLEDDTTGCHFVAVDVSGHEQDFKTLGGTGCVSLARVGAKWSFLNLDQGGGASLVVFGNGAVIETPLAFSQAEYVWDRLVLVDGSFLVSSFWEDANTAKDTNWLTPFDAQGAALGPSIAVVGYDSAPVLLARAGDHAMAAWQWTNVNALSVTALGAQLSLAEVVTTDSPIYELSLFTQPNGDVLFVWILLDEKTNDFSLHARVIDPDGMPRGPATLLSNDVTSTQVHGAIESTGARALLTVTTKAGTIEALPLTCQ